MNPAAPQHRASRGRVVAVHRAPIFDESLTAPSDGVIHVQTLFQAVGEVARSSAREPVDAVLIHAPLANRPLDLVLSSIQRLDPSVMVFLVVEPDDVRSAEQARASGFDGVLQAPVSVEALEAALIGEVTPPADEEEEHPLDERLPPSAVIRETEAVEIAASPDAPRGDAGAGSRQPSAAGPAQVDASTIAPHEATQVPDRPAGHGSVIAPAAHRLGDVDMVETILRDPDAAVETAVRLIQQETGWTDVRLLPGDEASPFEQNRPGAVTAAALRVRFGSDDHGVLSCPGAEAAALEAWAAWLARWLSLAKAQRTLRALAYSDPLTGAWNRRFFDEFMPQAIEHARARRRTLVVMVFDVDDLKSFNDRHGHDAGDRVLRECVRLLQSVIRKGDRVCRIGGDEFVVVFADEEPPRRAGSTPVESVEVIARRFQDAICAARLPALGDGPCAGLSVSAGLATFPWDASDAESLLRVADLRALESKRRGKNALTIGPCPESDEPPAGSAPNPAVER